MTEYSPSHDGPCQSIDGDWHCIHCSVAQVNAQIDELGRRQEQITALRTKVTLLESQVSGLCGKVERKDKQITALRQALIEIADMSPGDRRAVYVATVAVQQAQQGEDG
jgi:predicted RNase H-like nuclease (RuvC/YqgF family)